MYSFAQRSDTRVVDEPLYGHYLRLTDAPQPHARELIHGLEQDGERAVRETVLGPCDRDVLFLKQMAHHLIDLDLGFLESCTNVLLIRDPRQMLPSLVNQVTEPTMRDAAYAKQTQLYDQLCSLGQQPVVIDSRDLQLDPAAVLAQLCERVGIAFDEAMLSWPAGPKPYDGPWAPYWYHNLHKSTGWMPYREKTQPFPQRLRPLLDECLPHYERLAEARLLAMAPSPA